MSTTTEPLVECSSTTACCLLCGGGESGFRLFARRASWTYVQCSGCGFVFLHPQPSAEALRLFYNEGYSVKPDAYAAGARRRAPKVLGLLRNHLPRPGRLLEIGCSYGFFLREAQKAGWEVAGIELNEEAAAYAKKDLGLRVFCGDLEGQHGRLGQTFDVVVLFHVIEHVPDPSRLLELCRQLTRRQGLLLIRTPNVNSLVAKLAGSGWQWLCPPAHLQLWAPSTLQMLLSKSGFQPVKTWSERGDAHSNLFELLCSFGRRVLARNTKANPASSTRQLADSWQFAAVKKVADLCYLPLRFALDPWLSATLQQPEVSVLATRSDLTSA